MHRIGYLFSLVFFLFCVSTSAFAAPKPERTLSLIGRGTVSAPDAKLDEAAAAGGLGFAYNGPWTEVVFSLTSGTKSTVGASLNDDGTVKAGERRAYGYTILDPLSSKFNFSMLFGYYPFVIKTTSPTVFRWGPYTRIMLSDVVWAYEDNQRIQTIDVTPSGLELGFTSRFVMKTAVEDALLTVRMAMAFRRISGDIASSHALRASMWGSSQRTFAGPSVEIAFRFGAVSFGVVASCFSDTQNAGSANGLTDIRFLPTFSGEAPIIFPIQ